MKKILTIFMTAVLAVFLFSSCTKDSFNTPYYSESTVIENVSYSLEVYQADGDLYNWTVSNSTSEVTVKYSFSYDEKKAIRLDFEDLKNHVDEADNLLDFVFTHEFRYLNDEPHDALVYLTVVSGRVVANFVLGDKKFALPYEFIAGVVDALKPAE